MTKVATETAERAKHRAPQPTRRTEIEPAAIERLQEQIGNKATTMLVSRLVDAGIVGASGAALPELYGEMLGELEEGAEASDTTREPVERTEVDHQIDPPDDGGDSPADNSADAPSSPDDSGGDEPSADGAEGDGADAVPPDATGDGNSGVSRSSDEVAYPSTVSDDNGHRLNGSKPLDVLSARESGATPINSVQRWDMPDIDLPDISIPSLGDIVRQVPGYDLLTLVIGFDPASGDSVEPTPERLVGAIIGLAPGGAAIYSELERSEILRPVFELVDRELDQSNLTQARIEAMVETAWDEIDLTPRVGIIDDGIEVVSRHVGGLMSDIETFAGSLVDAVIEIIKNAALDQVEQLLAADPQANSTWELTKQVLHHDPLRDERVDASTEQIIESFLILIGREQELEEMKNNNTLAETAEWIDEQLGVFDSILTDFGGLVDDVLDALSPDQLPNLAENITDLVQRGVGLIQRVADFAVTVAEKVLELIKDSMLEMLDGHAQQVPGFHLVSVLAGQNPLTGATVERSPENIIKGFITLLPGGDQQYEQLQETGVIPDAAANIQAAIEALGISWEFVSGLFEDIWNSFTIEDLLAPLDAFDRVVDQFREPIERLFNFITTVAQEVFELILKLMGFPAELLQRIINNAMSAFGRIQEDPIGFLENMIAALRLGFSNFFDNILDHLLSGLADWLLGGLRSAGIEPPTELTLESILDLVMQVLGVSVDTLWEKLAERIGEERVAQLRSAADQLEGIWTFIADVQERGLVAIWEYIESKISTLWDTILEKAQDFIVSEIIEGVVTRLLSMLDPTGVMAVINGFVSFFQAVQSAIEYFREILEIIDRYVATIADIAAGSLESGAQQLEAGLSASIPVAIGFLANQVGLGDIAAEIQKIIEGIREVVDEALDWLLDRAMEIGTSMAGAMGFGPGAEDEAGEAGETDAAGVDASDHASFARHAAGRLKAAPIPDGQDPMEAKQAAATALEPSLSAQLEEPIGLRFVFTGGHDDAQDGEIEFQVVIAPNTTTHDDSAQVTTAMGHAQGNADGGGTKIVGTSGPYRTQGGTQDPRYSQNRQGLPYLKLIAEHVIPRQTVEGMSLELGGPAVPRSGQLDESMTTISIYDGAASRKTRSDVNKNTAEAATRHELDAARAGSRFSRNRLQTGVETLLAGYLTHHVAATAEAVSTEEGSNGSDRGTNSASPTSDEIGTAAAAQKGQIFSALEEEIERLAVEAENAEEGVDFAEFERTVQALQRLRGEIVSRSGDNPDVADANSGVSALRLSAKFNLGSARGIATLRFANGQWALELPGRSQIKEEFRNRVYASGPVSLGSNVNWVADPLERARTGEVDGSTAPYPPEYRGDVVTMYRSLTSQDDDTDAARQAAQSTPLPSSASRKPNADWVLGWVRSASSG